MDLVILNTKLEAQTILDTYSSLIWTDRYNEYGDFEIYTRMNQTILDYIKAGYYLRRNGSDHVMIIEDFLINSDVEDGDTLTITGRSLESILDRRIIWGQKTLNGNLQNGIETLLNECIISPSNADRKIDNFIFKSSDDPAITELTIQAQYTGDNLYEVIKNICLERDLGFRVTLDENNQFVFELYFGADRSYDQTVYPYVIFSPKFDNLVTSNYVENKSSYKNVTLVGGEGEGSARKYATVGDTVGLERREIFTDARDISSNGENNVTLSSSEYTELLLQRGKEKLSEVSEDVSFEGEAETTSMFVYGKDFFNGDIIQIEDGYGHAERARILEVVTSEEEGGVSVYPTFSMIKEKGEN